MKNKLIKFGLFGLAILSLGIACFSNFSYGAEQLLGFERSSSTISISANGSSNFNSSAGGIFCFSVNTSSCTSNVVIKYTDIEGELQDIRMNTQYKLYCFSGVGGLGTDGNAYRFVNSYSNTCTVYSYTPTTGFTVGSCPSQYTSLECQSEYSLIPVSSVDSNYCESNNLCNSSDCYTGDLSSGVSNIFINDIFHPGAFNVVVNIPDEIDWEYAYTNSGSNFNLDVYGYNQDTEYIDNLIDVQNYKPSSEDFTKVFSNFSNFGGLLIACLFVILVFYFVKKMFK